MKYKTTLLVLASLSGYLHAQTDSIVAENIFSYELIDGKAGRNRIIIKQNTYDLTGRQVRQIFYDSLANIDRSTLFFYEGDHLVSKETYGAEFTIDSVERIHYNADGLKDRVTSYVVVEGKPEKRSWTTYMYEQGKMVKSTTFNNNKKWMIKRTFVDAGSMQTERRLFRKGKEKSGIKELILERSFEGNRITLAKITATGFDKSVNTTNIRYGYDANEKELVSKSWYNEKDSLIKEILFRYYPEGYIRSVSTKLPSGDFIEHLVHERRSHNIVLGKPEMFPIPE